MFCQKCSGGIFLNQIKDRLVCDRCGFEILIQDGFVIFHPEDSNMHSGMESAILDDLAFYEEKHFWMKTRRFFIRRTFDKYINNTDKIIEIGAGTGNISRCLMENGYKDISVGEVHLNGLEYAKCYGIKNRYQFDLMKTPFLEHFDTVGMFDVLEHIDNDDLAVKNIYKMLKHGGKAIVTVPAHKWLWSKQDTIAYHRQRYEVNQLKRLFEANGFKILKASAFFSQFFHFCILENSLIEMMGISKVRISKIGFM